MQDDRPEADRRGAVYWCAGVIAAAALLRLGLAWSDHSVFWPDEIHQSLEQAHRAVFGYGLLPWEFRDGARSWFFPGAIAALWTLASASGVESSLALVMLARAIMVACSVTAIIFAAKLAAESRGPRAGLAVTVILATFAPAVVFSYRAMSETASAPLIAAGAWFLSKRSSRSALYAGLAVALACLCRYQNGLFVLVFAGTMLLGRRWREALAFCSAGFGVALLGGGLDWVTWGRPFHSFLTYIEFNLLRDGASTFGVEPFTYYVATLWSSVGPLLAVLAACFCIGVRFEPVLGGAVVAFGLVHCLLPHKEFRFLVPCLPLFATVAGVGVDAVLRRLPRPRSIGVVSALTLTASFGFGLVQLEYGDMGQYHGTERESASVWSNEEEPSLLLADAGEQPDLCGVAVLGGRAAFTGGYTYLHRDVPLIYEHQLCSAAPANYVITRTHSAESMLPTSYQLAAQRGEWALYKRPGVCQPNPDHYDRVLEGARDMGLALARARQARDGSLRFDLIKHGGSFGHGWGHGEIVDCDPARWVTSTQATIDFDFEFANRPYQLTLRARAHEGAERQRFAVSVNGVRAHVGAMSRHLETYTLDIPEGALRPGENRIELAFREAVRASANDERELAAFIRTLEILPAQDDFSVEVALAESRAHLVSGFHSSEQAEDSTFVWSAGTASELEGRLVWSDTPYVLEILAEAVPLVPSQEMRVLANGTLVGSLDVPRTWARRRLVIPATALVKGTNRIRFEYEAAVRPADVSPKLADTRQLAVRFRRVALEPIAAARELDLGSASARPYLLDGWSVDERDGERTAVWSDGPRASALLSFDGIAKPILRVTAKGYFRALPLEVDVLIDGERVGSFAAPDGWQSVAIPLGPGDYSGRGRVVTFGFSRTSAPLSPPSEDGRRLALRVDRIWAESEGQARSAETALTTLRAVAR